MIRTLKEYSFNFVKITTIVVIVIVSSLILYQIDGILPNIDLSPGIRIPSIINAQKVSWTAASRKKTRVQDTINDVKSNQDKIRLRFMEREENLKRVCSEHVQLMNVQTISYTRQRMLYNEEYKLIACIIAKVGSTSWRYLFLKLLGLSSVKITHLRSKENRVLTQLSRLKSTKESIRLLSRNNFYKILTVRHPLDRILSLYRDKFNEGNITNMKAEQVIWRRNFFKMYMNDWHRNNTNGHISLEDALEFMFKYLPDDIHIKKMVSHCSPCSINYDYIIKMETMSEDVNYIFSTIGIKNITLFDKNSSTKKVRKHRFEIFATMSTGALQRMFDHIKEDLILFDYKLPDYLMTKLNLTV